jgi:hypothetical protein
MYLTAMNGSTIKQNKQSAAHKLKKMMNVIEIAVDNHLFIPPHLMIKSDATFRTYDEEKTHLNVETRTKTRS